MNCSEDETFATSLDQANVLPAGIIIIYTALNYSLSITASLGNALILIALRKESSLRPPIKQLFQCLALTDLCVGLSCQPVSATIMLNAVAKIDFDIICRLRRVTYALSYPLCQITVFTLTAISVDRLVFLLLGLQRYRQVFTLRRVRAVIIWSWLLGVSLGFIPNFWNYRVAFIANTGFSLLCVFISIFSNTKIFLTLRQHQNKMQQGERRSNGAETSLNIERFKKTVFSIAWLQLALVACYVPLDLSVLMIKVNGWSGTITVDIIWRSAVTLLFANSTLNPILYCWKIRGVKKAVKDIIKQFYHTMI